MSWMLHVEGLRKRFGAVTALDGIDLKLGGDELLVVLGPTGAGKTTLLRCIAGLEQADAGRVCMAGADVTGAHPAARDVAFVFQNFALYPDWTVRRNLAFPLQAPGRKLSAEAIAAQITFAAQLLRIEHLLERKASRLSGGEMQRVAIGRAIVRKPRLFLMDEPLTNLDAKLRESLRVELVRLRRELGTPMVYVTHDQAEALSMGDRIAVLQDGQLLQVGTPEAVYRRPVSPAVARQLGQPAINVLPAQRVDGHWCLDGGAAVAVAAADAPERVTLGIRPEDLAVTGGAHPAEVLVVEDIGPMVVLLARWCGHEVHLLSAKHSDIAVGDTIRPQIDPERLVVWE
ncbi:MAG: ABC transporter ATP-binding protein [Planctomycetota bacterium]|jgi:multiple sugar transport system ATP-binding protein|nr:ABC transporter ATP-binding protein [Planctomycetota bacterium]